MIYIFDIDGTIADITHRLHFIGADKGGFTPYEDKTKDWDSFYKASEHDKPIHEVIAIARALSSAGHILVYSTGRQESIKDITLTWMLKYWIPDLHNLYMRATNDHREDSIVKAELLEQIAARFGAYNIAGVFEDRQQVVDMYRARGLRVFQVAKGDF